MNHACNGPFAEFFDEGIHLFGRGRINPVNEAIALLLDPVRFGTRLQSDVNHIEAFGGQFLGHRNGKSPVVLGDEDTPREAERSILARAWFNLHLPTSAPFGHLLHRGGRGRGLDRR